MLKCDHLGIQRNSAASFPFGRKSKKLGYAELQRACGGKFVSASEFFEGVFRNERSISWWTSEKVKPEEVFDARLRLGIWTEITRPVILELDLEKLQGIRRLSSVNSQCLVPLETDAFAYPVFSAQPISNALHGLTIDLTGFPGNLTPGLPEYVLHNVPVEAVSLAACPESDDPESDERKKNARKQINERSAQFWQALIDYHIAESVSL
jgi:hypothetical protein